MTKKFIFFLFLLLLVSNANAGVTGKIAGKILDSETKQVLPGVNVVLEGTTMGAASDVNGFYVILNVPVGRYDVKATMMGYNTVVVKNVRVSIDLTTEVNMELSPMVLEATTEVTIVAERSLIQKDEVSTRHFVSSDEIGMQPVDSFEEIAQNQAGVIGSHFRGGRDGQVLVLVDGIPVRDPAGTYSDDVVNFAGFTSDIPEYGIQELEVSLGGFSAEYGNVQSGVLNLAMKEGAQKYSGVVRVTSNDFGGLGLNEVASLNSQHLFGDSLGAATINGQPNSNYWEKKIRLIKKIYELNLTGPEPLTTYLLPQLGLKLPGSASFSLSAEITDKDRGFYLNQQSFDQSYQGKLTYKISPNHKLVLGGVRSQNEWDQFYFPAAKFGPAPDYPVNEFFDYSNLDGDTLNHYIYVHNSASYRNQQGQFIPQSGITADSSVYNYVRHYYVAGMQEYLWDRLQKSNIGYLVWTHTLSPTTFYEVRLNSFYTNYHYSTRDIDDRDGDGDTSEDLVWDPDLAGPHPIYREREDNYWWVRGDDPGYRDQSSWTYSIKTDLVSQLTNNHLLKGGFEFYLHRTQVENISWTLGYGIFRKDIWDKKTVDFGAYIQDKLEFSGIIALFGLRFDLFDPTGFGDDIFYPGNYNYPYTEVDKEGFPIFTNPEKAEMKYQLSPRLGISHPITDRDVLHFTYGHYFQRPDNYFLFRNYQIQSLTKVGNYVGNPDLKPEKTVAYEIGIEHLFTNDIKGTVTGYYKDVTNLMNWQKFVGRSIQNAELNVYTNADYGNVKGLEFTFSKRPKKFWGASVNYTFSVAKGRSSDYSGGSGSFTDVKRMNILDYDQTHTVNASVTLRTPEDFGFKVANFNPLSNWISNFQFVYGSGLPYSSFGTGKINDQRRPWTSTTDVKLIRQIKTSGLSFEIFIDVFNLFDRQNVSWIGDSQFYDSTNPTINGDPTVVRHMISGEYIRNPQAYSNGREVRFGLTFQF